MNAIRPCLAFTLLAFDLWCDATFGEGVRIPIGGMREASE